MKNEALRRGAEEAPISLTGGIEGGSGVVSMRTCWENLWGGVSLGWEGGEGEVDFGWRAAIVKELGVGRVVVRFGVEWRVEVRLDGRHVIGEFL